MIQSLEGKNMIKTNKRVLKLHSEKDVLTLLKEKSQGKKNALKFITLSIGIVNQDEINWAVDFAIRSINNFLERAITKKSIENSFNVGNRKPPSKFYKKRAFDSFSGKQVKDFIRGGVYKIELTQNLKDRKKYNLHLHVLCEAGFLPQSFISYIWHNVLSKPFQGKNILSRGIVDIQSVGDTESDIINTYDYLIKPVPEIRNGNFKNTRLLSKFGTWYNR